MTVISRSDQYKIQRRHRSNTTRWMHNSDDIIPIREPDRMSLKEWAQTMVITVGLTILMFLVWWYGG